MGKGSKHDSIGLAVILVSPRLNINLAWDRLGVASNNKLVEQAPNLGIVENVTGAQRFCVFRYTPYW